MMPYVRITGYNTQMLDHNSNLVDMSDYHIMVLTDVGRKRIGMLMEAAGCIIPSECIGLCKARYNMRTTYKSIVVAKTEEELVIYQMTHPEVFKSSLSMSMFIDIVNSTLKKET